MLEADSPYAELLAPYFQLESSDLQSWMESPYEQNKNIRNRRFMEPVQASVSVQNRSR